MALDSVTGEGVDQLLAELERQISGADNAGLLDGPQGRTFRMPIDRVFTIKGFGTVVTGTPSAGSLSRDEVIAVYPPGLPGKLRGIEIFNQPAATARAGQRTAFNLSGLSKEQLQRGMVLAPPGIARPTRMIDVSLHVLKSAPQRLKYRSPIRFHHGSGEWLGRLYPIGVDVIEGGTTGLAQIRLEAPCLCFPGERFVVRRYSPLTTIGGGVVLANHPSKHKRRHMGRIIPDLEEIESALNSSGDVLSVQLRILVRQAGIRGIDRKELVLRTGFTASRISAAIAASGHLLSIPQEPDRIVDRSHVDILKHELVAFLRDFHEQNPLSAGVSKEELRRKLLAGGSPQSFDFVLGELEREERVRVLNSRVALFGAAVVLTDDQLALREAILAKLEAARFQPSSLDDLIQELPFPKQETSRLFYHLIETGELVRVSEDLVFRKQQLERVIQLLRQRFPKGISFAVPEFKEIFGLSRKYAIPILEYLDRERITRRSGDRRAVV
jgi:selenocysteine-specific elongation factor